MVMDSKDLMVVLVFLYKKESQINYGSKNGTLKNNYNKYIN